MASDISPTPAGWVGQTKFGRFGWMRAATLLTGLAALAAYLFPRLTSPGQHWPGSDVNVYWWGGHQAARDAAIYAPQALYHFTYPPFAAVLFGLSADVPVVYLKDAIAAGSIVALVALCWMVLGASGMRRRPEAVFAVVALALLSLPVAKTLQLGEVDLIVAALVGVDLLPRRNDGRWWQGIATGLAAGIKLTPLIFVIYLLFTRRVRAAVMAATTFAATIVAGFVLLGSQSRAFWLEGVFLNAHRVGDSANTANQSLSGALARVSAELGAAGPWWLGAALLTGTRRDHRRHPGSPPWSPACGIGVLRHHWPAGLASLVDPSLGMGGASSGRTCCDCLAAAITLVWARRCDCRHCLLRPHSDPLARPSAQPGATAGGRHLRALRPGPVDRHCLGPRPGAPSPDPTAWPNYLSHRARGYVGFDAPSPFAESEPPASVWSRPALAPLLAE